MNKSERDKLRWQTTNKELLSLLNALDEADEQIITQINTNYKLLAQIDKAEARAEALERAIKLDGKCYSCIHSNSDTGENVCPDCSQGSNWQFDQAKFEKETR